MAEMVQYRVMLSAWFKDRPVEGLSLGHWDENFQDKYPNGYYAGEFSLEPEEGLASFWGSVWIPRYSHPTMVGLMLLGCFRAEGNTGPQPEVARLHLTCWIGAEEDDLTTDEEGDDG